jgi:structural maintenance of chromosome 4
MVTLQGQIIDLSGTMSGGGNKVLRGRMSSKVSDSVSPVQVTQLEKRMEGFEIKKKVLWD